MKNKKLLIIGSIFITIIILLIVNFLIFNNKQEITQTPETAGDIKAVTINDSSGALYNTFVNDEYLQIRKHLSSFIDSKNGNPDETVIVSNVVYPTRYNESNEYTFDAYSPSLDNSYPIVINKPRDGSYPAYFEVKNENFKINLLEYFDSNEFHED